MFNFLFCICCDFFRTALFSEKLPLLQSNYFDTTVTFLEQLFFSGHLLFFDELLFSEQSLLRSSYFFQNSYFFRVKLLPNSHHVSTRCSLRQLLFGTATFLAEELFRLKISTEELLFRSSYFCKASTFSEELHFGKKANFSENQYAALHIFFWRANFLEWLLFQKLSSLAATFSEELLFYNILFQKNYHFTGTLRFHSYTSYLSVTN